LFANSGIREHEDPFQLTPPRFFRSVVMTLSSIANKEKKSMAGLQKSRCGPYASSEIKWEKTGI
jgi:hypothetical protein